MKRCLFRLGFLFAMIASMLGGALTTVSAEGMTFEEFQAAKCDKYVQILEDLGVDPHGDGVDLQKWAANELDIQDEHGLEGWKRISPHRFTCGGGIDVLDGFVVQGLNEGWDIEVVATVPQDGAIDSCTPTTCALYTANELEKLGNNSYRSFTAGEMVQGPRITYWFIWDGSITGAPTGEVMDHTPDMISASTNSTANTSSASNDTGGSSDAPADQTAWMKMVEKEVGKAGVVNTHGVVADQYGAVVVSFEKDWELPAGWEASTQDAQGNLVQIFGDTAPRKLKAGETWSLYPTCDWRPGLGLTPCG